MNIWRDLFTMQLFTISMRRQIAAAEKYRKTHCGCTLHNAGIKSFVSAPGGYASGKSLYRVMSRMIN